MDVKFSKKLILKKSILEAWRYDLHTNSELGDLLIGFKTGSSETTDTLIKINSMYNFEAKPRKCVLPIWPPLARKLLNSRWLMQSLLQRSGF